MYLVINVKVNAITVKPWKSDSKGKTIHPSVGYDGGRSARVFDAIPMIARKLQTLMDVGLSYIRLGQSSTTLSGGEAQRVKLATELQNAIPVKPFIFWMNRQLACISLILNNFSTCYIACAIKVIPSW